MKILISTNSYWNLFNFRYDLLSKLKNQNHKLIIVSSKDKYFNKFKNIKCKHYYVNMKANKISIVNDIFLIFNYFKIFLKEKPDVYFSFTIKPNIYGSFIANLLGIKTVNNITGLGKTFLSNNILKSIVIFLYKISLRKSFKVFFHNNDDLSLFLKLNIIKNIQGEVIPGSGININQYEYSKLFNRDNKELIFLYIGRIRFDKGFVNLIEAFKLIKKDYDTIKLQVIGKIEKKNPDYIDYDLFQSWQDQKIIEYFGETDDIKKYIKNSDCVILLSFREGLSRSLLEASIMGRPIITTNVPGCKETIIDGVSGLLCKEKNTKDAFDKIIKFIELNYSERNKMGYEGHLYTKKYFNNLIIIKKYLNIIK